MADFISGFAINPNESDILSRPKKILLGQLGANGDCLFATAIARQIKADFPGCHLTWAIGSAYRSILNGNPFVDDIWEITASNHQETTEKWALFEEEAIARKKCGDFDEVFLTQIAPNNFKNFDGTVRTSLFRGYPKPITVSVAPVVQLLPDEIDHVNRFVEAHNLNNKKHVILFECASNSGQSFVTPAFAFEVAQKLVEMISNVCVILSSNVSIRLSNPCIIDGSILSFRENAELTKYCTLLVGCSSGISWLCTSDWAKPLPMVQLLSKDKSVYASFVHDYEHRGVGTDTIIEMTDCSTDKVFNCINTIITKDFSTAKTIFHQRIPLRFNFYSNYIYSLLSRGKYKEVITSIKHTYRRYGLHPHFLFCILRELVRYVLIISYKKVSQSA